MALVLFFFLAGTCVGSVLGMILSRDRTHGVLFLVLAFAALGGVFGLLDAPFVAAVQVLVYAGAILVLFLFVIMTLDPAEGRRRERGRWVIVPALVLSLVLLGEILLALKGAGGGASGPGPAPTAGLGALLLGPYLYAFEIASLLIVASLTGAVALAGRKDGR
jgi:NADH-quinone oxidoreductase subunit J